MDLAMNIIISISIGATLAIFYGFFFILNKIWLELAKQTTLREKEVELMLRVKRND